MDRVVVVASTSEAIHDLENYIWDNAEMVVLAPVMPSIVRADPFRFMTAVVNPSCGVKRSRIRVGSA